MAHKICTWAAGGLVPLYCLLVYKCVWGCFEKSRYVHDSESMTAPTYLFPQLFHQYLAGMYALLPQRLSCDHAQDTQ